MIFQKKIPFIALVGRLNVGKSTLFNKLTRNYDALIADLPGLTRDRKYGKVKISGREFICIDTGGFDKIRDGIEKYIAEQFFLAVKESDAVLFIVDARTGLMPADFSIAKHLHLIKKKTFLVANKTDGINPYRIITDFRLLGFSSIHPISALHGRGVADLLESIILPFLDEINQPETIDASMKYWKQPKDNLEVKSNRVENYFYPKKLPIKLAIVGRPNVGKSTIINRFLGQNRVVVYNTPGTTRDSIYIPIQYDGRQYILIDTAGIRKRNRMIDKIEKFSVDQALQAIKDSNIVMLVIDAHEGITNQDLSLLNFIFKCGRSLVIVVNKWDGLSNKIRDEIKRNISYRLDFINFAQVYFISALYSRNINNLLSSVYEEYKSSTTRRSTAVLTNIMHMAVEDHQPPLVRGRRVKLKYVHVGGYNPLILVIHGNQVKELPNSYISYLANYFRKSLEAMSMPIRIHFKEGNNPFIKNQISEKKSS